ncbi:rhodanese-like domain-containing protein [Kibdelosporangium persicum]|uniref:Molybdopterin biosynthesis protein MoeB n=1 Tax=Kibdelosporangium persicum TaxID=2698649 RepID=A0ABX2EYY0_9PSEU|nr:rhodanese-like domain-containing protein [Kibdelosporangium persicum]NRN64192.1 Molybdopterin biosynthesis protein MoeB [Kibdelosporangium persicum]
MNTIARLLAEARRTIVRHTPAQAAEALRAGATLVDLRPTEYRWRFGEIPGAVPVSRHVLEWRLDVTSPWHIKELRHGDPDQEIILICNEGYTSSLAAHQVMTQLGLTRVSDVLGGFAAWKEAGYPVMKRLAN